MKQVILYIAMSLDGFIADQSGGVEWLEAQKPEASDSESIQNPNLVRSSEKQEFKAPDTESYSAFIENIDTIIMGRHTYQQIVTELSPDEWPYPGKKTLVLTHHPLKDQKEISFISKPVKQLIQELRSEEGGNIWICGGASLAAQCIEENLIDKYHITVIPILLGKGIRLFSETSSRIPLKLLSAGSDHGMTDLVYERA